MVSSNHESWEVPEVLLLNASCTAIKIIRDTEIWKRVCKVFPTKS